MSRRRFVVSLTKRELRAVREAVEDLFDGGTPNHGGRALQGILGKLDAAVRRGELQVAP